MEKRLQRVCTPLALRITGEVIMSIGSDSRNPFIFKTRTKFLKEFRNDSKMELLFLVRDTQSIPEWSMADILHNLSSYPQSFGSMKLFIRDMVDVGAFIEVKINKKSKHLLLSIQLKEELEIFNSMMGIFPIYSTVQPSIDERCCAAMG